MRDILSVLALLSLFVVTTASAAKWEMTLVRVTYANDIETDVDALTLNTQGSWVYDDQSQTLTLIGSQSIYFQFNEFPATGMFTHEISNVAFDLSATTITGGTYVCVEGTFGGVLGANLCANTTFGSNSVDETTLDYTTVPGTRVVGGDDVAVDPQQQLAAYSASLITWDGNTLNIQTPDWNTDGTGGSSTAGYQLEFTVNGPSFASPYRVELQTVVHNTTSGPVGSSASGAVRGIYDATAKTVTMDAGTLDLNYFIGPVENPLQTIYDHKVTGALWDLDAGTFVASSFHCAEGSLGPTVSAFMCAGTQYGLNNINETTTDYATVPGTRTVGGDDTVTADQQQAADYAGVQTGWDGNTLTVDSHIFVSSGDTVGHQLIFDNVNFPPVGMQFLVALEEVRLGDPGGIIFGAPIGTLYGFYDDGPDTVTLNPGTVSIAFEQGSNQLFTHELTDADFDLLNGTIAVSGFECIDGSYSTTAQQSFCGNYDWGTNGIDDSSFDYSTVPGTRSIGGDDVALGPMRQAADYGSFLHAALPTQLTAKSADWTLNETSTWVSTAGTLLIFDTQPPPVLTITSPSDGAALGSHKAPFNLDATATDATDGDLSGQVTWQSDIDGAIASPAYLSGGVHTITASVTNSQGISRDDSVQFEVHNVPVVTIDSPEDGAVFLAGETIQAAGTAIDADDGDVSNGIQWLMGSFGNDIGASLAITAEPGVYLIEARAFDAGSSNYTSDTVQILVNRDDDTDGMADNWEVQFGIDDPNTDADNDGVTNIQEFQDGSSPVDVAPVVSILEPASGASAGVGETIDFSASATDTEDGDLSSVTQWSSDRDGSLGSGASLATPLSLGEHVITATVQDSAGQSPLVTATVSIGVGVAITGDGDINEDSNVDVSDLLLLEQAVIDMIDLE